MAYNMQGAQGGYYPPQQGGYGGGYAQTAPMGGSRLEQRRARVNDKHGACGPCCAFCVGLLACCCLEDIICAGCLDAVF
ncbi:Hypothetical protein MSYG_3693 [Malassezia sympodialis ATCC 42132]|uniref:Cysteine-rich transmembrane CYSTM domain-containing protein n=1 Tax=Malassezia sympodialis (strain ATCC 42132) TaxID=1230383 RepID=A0A1M8AAH3_MALS4|nr:Hypothetical protein MSYG_3693 [Malassezia sympodialis ATCC 42132]